MSKIIRLTQKSPSHQKKSSISNSKNTETPAFILTCQSGLESLVRRECERMELKNIRVQDRLVKSEGTPRQLYELLLRSRFANRVYLNLGEEKIENFDELYDLCESIPWGTYLTGRERIVIEASSTRSALTSVPTIQSITQKAIYSTLRTPNTTSGVEVHILILIIDNIAHILLDVTGDPLHKRGYRTESGDAPIKENLAAALVAFANWKYQSPLLDPFCGSGTIAIEAAMMARNIAPGLQRHFRIEELPCYDRSLMEETRKELASKVYPSGKYTLIARDIDPSLIEKARRNAERAGVSEDIHFEIRDFLSDSAGGKRVGESIREDQEHPIIITNPPYGNRLGSDNLSGIYDTLMQRVEQDGGGFITNYPMGKTSLANKKLLNGGEECRFWYKKSSL